MICQALLATQPFTASALITVHLGSIPDDAKVTGIIIGLDLLWSGPVTIDREGVNESPVSSPYAMDTVLHALIPSVILTSGDGMTMVNAIGAKDLRKLYVLKTGQELPGNVGGPRYHGGSGAQAGRFQTTIPVLFTQPRLQDPLLFCPTGKRLRGGDLQIQIGAGALNSLTVDPSSRVTVHLTWVQGTKGEEGPYTIVQRRAPSSSPDTLGPGLTTHVFDGMPATNDAALSTISYDIDGPMESAYKNASASSLVAQCMIECGSYSGFNLPGAIEPEYEQTRGTLRDLLTPLKWVPHNTSVQSIPVSDTGESISFSSSSSAARNIIVERITTSGESEGGKVLAPRGSTTHIPMKLMRFMPRVKG